MIPEEVKKDPKWIEFEKWARHLEEINAKKGINVKYTDEELLLNYYLMVKKD